MNSKGMPRSHIVIWIMMFATFLWGLTMSGLHPPTIIKLVFATTLWAIVAIFPYSYARSHDLKRQARILLSLIVFLTLIAVVQGALDSTTGHAGNKWITMFGNDDCMFMLLAPCFMYLAVSPDSVITLKRASQLMLVLSALGLVTGNYAAGGVLWFGLLLYPYMKKGYRPFVLLLIGVGVFSAFFAEDTSRSTLLVFFIFITSYICVYVIKNKKLVWVVCLTFILVPLAYSIVMLVNQEYSIVQVLLDLVMQETGDQELSSDTRTFLFWELAEDLSKNDAWLFGKGAYSHYYSDFFARSTSENADSHDRLGVEVTILQLLLRSGIAYVIVYYSLITTAVVSALKNSKNRFLITMAVVASGWSLFSCISYLNGCKFLHLGFFLLLGCCVSKRWLSYTDEDIKKILKR